MFQIPILSLSGNMQVAMMRIHERNGNSNYFLENLGRSNMKVTYDIKRLKSHSKAWGLG